MITCLGRKSLEQCARTLILDQLFDDCESADFTLEICVLDPCLDGV